MIVVVVVVVVVAALLLLLCFHYHDCLATPARPLLSIDSISSMRTLPPSSWPISAAASPSASSSSESSFSRFTRKKQTLRTTVEISRSSFSGKSDCHTAQIAKSPMAAALACEMKSWKHPGKSGVIAVRTVEAVSEAQITTNVTFQMGTSQFAHQL